METTSLSTSPVKSFLKRLYFDPAVEFSDMVQAAKKEWAGFRWKKFLMVMLFLFLLSFLGIIISGLSVLVLRNHFRFEPAFKDPYAPGIIFMFLLVVREEIIFRLPARHNRLNLFLAIGVFNCYLAWKFQDWFLSTFGSFFIDFQVLSVVGATLLVFPILAAFYRKEWIKLWWVLLTFLFGVIHFVNFPTMNPFDNVWISLLLITPQLVGSAVFMFARIRYGFFYCLTLHFLWNIVSIYLLS